MKRPAACLLLTLAACAAPALAQDVDGKLNQRYWIQLGAFNPSIDSHAQADHPQSGKEGTYLNFEDVVLGLHVTNFKVFLQGLGTVNGSAVAVHTEDKHKTVPLPTIGAYGTYAFAPDWVEYRFSGPQVVLDAGF